MNVCILGAGFWSRYQALGWKEVGATIAGIADPRLEKAEALGRELNVPVVCETGFELLDKISPDVLDVITPVSAHVACVQLAAERRLPVICQKPMAPTLDHAKALVQFCETRGVPFHVHENWRFQRPIRELAQHLSNIGTLFRARIQYSNAYPVFTNQPALALLPQFMLMDMGCHILDVARYLFGEPRTLWCQTAQITPGIAGEDVATVTASMHRCPTVTVELSYASRLTPDAFPQTRILVEGSKGTLELNLGFEIVETTAAGSRRFEVKPETYAWSEPAYALVHQGMVGCLSSLYDALQNGTEPETTASDNLKTLQFVFACYDSASRGQLVNLEGP